ncbi:MAG TPA: thiolase family protein [Chloroflexota bacterium]|nr:thiolase family protein [Chloroflexota bacterium]
MELRTPVIVDAVRTPFGRHGGALRAVRPDDLAAHVIRALVERSGIPPDSVEDVFLGDANGAGEDNRNIGRMAGLLAGLPVEVPGATVNRLCGSGLQAVVSAAREIQTGSADVVIAGGVESMTRAPYVTLKPDTGFARGNTTMWDTTLGWRMVNPRMEAEYPPISLGETAERVAERYGVTREDQDCFALRSHRRAAAAGRAGSFDEEIVAVDVPVKGGMEQVTADEGIRPDTSLEKLAGLRPAFTPQGTVTAGNSSPLSDGAAALLIMSEGAAETYGLRPLVRFLGAATAGVHPDYMGMGPVPATHRLLGRLGLGIEDVDIVELNEAFAAQALAVIRQLGLSEDRVNPNGGAISIGHPLGASGARLAATLARDIARRGVRYGLATMCIGVGQGISAMFERAT